MVLTVGDPGDGVLARLPGDIHLYQSERQSAFQVPAMRQDITVQMPLGDYTVVRLPRTVTVDNAAGRFAVSVRVVDERLIYKRSVEITGAGSWEELRAVLLEAADGRHRDIVLRPGGES